MQDFREDVDNWSSILNGAYPPGEYSLSETADFQHRQENQRLGFGSHSP